MTTGFSTIRIAAKRSIMCARPIIIGVTGRAGTRIGRRGIGYVLVVLRVTGTTPYVAIVVARIVAAARVVIIDRCPTVCGMADVAVFRGNKMFSDALR